MAQWPNICKASNPKVAGLSPPVFTLYYVFFLYNALLISTLCQVHPVVTGYQL